ncbi:hypothetical protein [Stenotrophomonas sp. Y-13]|uniref:hypothetical protein n=1 Tax=Stenotrophomonas sp. Y-13 TaxID=3384161 RepID=UPI0039172160
MSEDIAERLHVLLFPTDADHVASSLDDEQPLQRESFDFLQHVFARQAKQLPVFVGQQSVVIRTLRHKDHHHSQLLLMTLIATGIRKPV